MAVSILQYQGNQSALTTAGEICHDQEIANLSPASATIKDWTPRFCEVQSFSTL